MISVKQSKQNKKSKGILLDEMLCYKQHIKCNENKIAKSIALLH